MKYVSGLLVIINLVLASDPSTETGDPASDSYTPSEQDSITAPPSPSSSSAQDTLIPMDYAGVMQMGRDFSENANLQRYTLQNTLIHNEPILKTRLESALESLNELYQTLQSLNGRVINLTTVVNADASAGGLLAISRGLYSEVPNTHKLVQKVVDGLTKMLAGVARSINETLYNTQLDFQAQIQSQADSVASILAQQDRAFAAQANAQKKAMVRATNKLRKQALADAGEVEMSVNSTQTHLSKLSNSIDAFTSETSRSLDQLSGLPASMQAQLVSSARDVKENLQSALTSSETEVELRMQKNADSSLANVQSAGAQLSRQLLREINKTQANITNNLGLIDGKSASRANDLALAIQKGSSNASQAISRVLSTTLDSLNSVSRSGNTVSMDAAQVAEDGSSILNQLGTKMAITRSGYLATLGSLQSKVPSQLQASLQQMMSRESGFSSDLVQELLRENGGIAFISQFTDEQLGKLGIGLDGHLAANQHELANRGFSVEGQVQDFSASINRNFRKVKLDSTRAKGDAQSALEALAGTMGISVEDLSAAVEEAASNGQKDLGQLSAFLSSRNSHALQNVLGLVQSFSDNGNSDLSRFVSGNMAGAWNLTKAQFDQISSILTDLLDEESQAEQSHASLVSNSSAQHSQRIKTLKKLSKRLQTASMQNMGTAKLLRSNMQTGLAQIQSRFTQQMAQTAHNSEVSASSGLGTIDQLFGNLNSTWSRLHNTVENTVADVGVNLDAASQQIASLGVKAAQSNTAVSSASYSILAASQKDEGLDFSTIDQQMNSAQSGFREALEANASTATDMALAGILGRLNSTEQGQNLAGSYLESLKNALDQIQASLWEARKASDDKSMIFKSQVGNLRMSLVGSNREIEHDLTNTISQFQAKLIDKEQSLNATTGNLSSQLNELEQMVVNAQKQLGQSLRDYQYRIDGLIGQIRSYMNLSSNADELAIARNIADQLSSVNGTQVRMASVRAGLEDRMGSLADRRNQTESLNEDLLYNLGASALSAQNGSAEAELALTNRLTAVGGNLDSSVSQARGKIMSAKNFMSNLVQNDSMKVSSELKISQADQETRYASVTSSTSDVSAQSRRAFLDNLHKMNVLNDGLNITSSELGQLLSNTNDSLSDISTSARSHFKLASSTLESLRADDAEKIASVSDVMAAFAVVVVRFLNETQLAMKAVMSEMNRIDGISQTKLTGVQRRTGDEINYLNSVLNASSEQFRFNLEQERAVQEALQAALAESQRRLIEEEKREKADINSLVSQISDVRKGIKSNGQAQISRVRKWIQSHIPNSSILEQIH